LLPGARANEPVVVHITADDGIGVSVVDGPGLPAP
jgi:hypothetical protein